MFLFWLMIWNWLCYSFETTVKSVWNYVFNAEILKYDSIFAQKWLITNIYHNLLMRFEFILVKFYRMKCFIVNFPFFVHSICVENFTLKMHSMCPMSSYSRKGFPCMWNSVEKLIESLMGSSHSALSRRLTK